MAVPVTPEEKNSPLYKYFERPIDPVPADILDKIERLDFTPGGGIHPTEKNIMFEEGYLPGEFGVYMLEDGGMMVANFTPMPGATPEMFDWWFAWHGLASMRYKIWDKDDHYYCQTQNVEQALDSSLSYKERYWDTTHDVKEAVQGTEPNDLRLHFVRPEYVGWDPEKLKTFGGTIVCTPGPAIMSHFVRPTADGCELRTRFWLGYMAHDGIIDRIPEMQFTPERGKNLLKHNVKEFTHLAKILPEVYAEFRDDFTVGLNL
ncbi:MAG: phloretin hydrolase [Parasporobacterium sp.]|nr:phloretin hydrolase [Parasporobacterium sp.]